MTLQLFPNDTRADVLVYGNFFTETGVQTHVTVTRINPDGTEVILLADHLLLCDEFYYFDVTVPLDVPVSYRINSTPDDVNTVLGPVTVAGSGQIHLTDPTRPWADLVMDLCGQRPGPCDPAPQPCLSFMRWGNETYAADANLVPILNRERPADIYARRKDVSVSFFRFLSRHDEGCGCITDVRTLFTAGGPVHLRFPAEYCIPDRTYQPGDLEMSYLAGQTDQRKPYRLWEVPLVSVDDITGKQQGVEDATWCDVNDTYATYADLTATGLFWGQVMAGEATEPAPLDGYGGGGYGEGPYGD